MSVTISKNKVNKRYCFDIKRYDNDSFLILGAKNNSIFRIDENIEPVYELPQLKDTSDMIWNEDKTYFLIADTSGKSLIYSLKDCKVTDKFNLCCEPFCNSFISDGSRFIISDDYKLLVYDIETKILLKTEILNTGRIIKAGNYVYNFYPDFADKSEIRTTVDIINLSNFQKLKSFNLNIGSVTKIKENYDKQI